ncbi:type IX secretion system sortase PorU [Spirosoma sp. BT702]|uniref:Type IX secretion system sortase PorU n=2 Tax=Spirosoma profusum TaxID=2771354 RepID=A0A926XVA4_9BACT|nr:type IX secretion system sortase PorU [Spirosoma profusum]
MNNVKWIMGNGFLRRSWTYYLLLLIIHYSLSIIHAPALAQSVLREGIWVKIGVTSSGVYRLSQSQLARISPAFASTDPRKLRLYGNGGAVLPQPNSTPRINDLAENAIQVAGEADGRFDADDAIIFFGQSPHVIRYDSVARRFSHQINAYSDTTFYFLTIGTTSGLRIQERPAGAVSATAANTTFDDYQFQEKDLVKTPTVRSGREWLGEYLTIDTTKIITFDMPGLVANSPIRVVSSVMAGATSSTAYRFGLNDVAIGSVAIPSVSGYEYDFQGVLRSIDTLVAKPTAISPLRISVTFQKRGQISAQGYLNFVGVQARRELRQYDSPTWARRLGAGSYAVRQATNALRIWDVTNPLVPATQSYSLSSAQDAAWSSTRMADYFLFTDTQLITPVSLVSVANQDLHSQPTPDLVIVTPAAWRDQAERLATFRREHDQLSVLVATTSQVYNEFGSGRPDVTAIRDMVRYFYLKQPNKLRYLLLFGDATYDYRNIMGMTNPTQQANMVPVYESRESQHPVLSYSSDDYFGFMGADEGEWPESVAGDYQMVIGVGRLPVKSASEAQTVVDKLIRYSSDKSVTGDWQTKVMMIADDGDGNIHQGDANSLAAIVETQSPMYRPERVFLDAFPQENTANGQKAPTVNQLINQAMVDGRLVINYSGHGGVLALADEQIVTLQDILSWKNRRLPLMVTATCQFGRYDDPNVNSGAELALLSRIGGPIGLLTTTRPVYANTNLLLNEAFYRFLFKPINGQMPRLGDVIRLTKNNSLAGSLNRNFALLGDPSMRLAYPQAQVQLTQINGKLLTDTARIDTLKALQTVELSGEIRQQGSRLADFSGTLRLTLYDKSVTRATLGSEAGSPRMTYQIYNSPLFTGQVPVQQGRFVVRFTMPKDINYTVGPGKIYTYAIRSDSTLEALGNYDSLRVGGSVFADTVDNQPPVVALSAIGGITDGDVVRVTGPDVAIRIGLTDNRGINIARSGLGHELTVRLNDQTPVIVNDLYVATGVGGRVGEVLYTFQNLEPGTYTIRAKAWDINNNSGEGSLTIVVSERPGLTLRSFRASPNPVVAQATLTAELDRSGEPLDWTWSVYNLSGLLITQQTGQCTDCEALVEIGTWDGRAVNGQPMPNGLYLVQLQIHSAADGTSAKGAGRLILLK